VCLGAKAKAANKQLKRDYEYKLARRERSWMQQLSVTNVEHLQHEQGIDASNLALANVYSDIQENHGKMIDAAMEQSQQDWKEYLVKNEGDQRKAAGQLGRSTDRISAVDLGAYLKKGNDLATKLTDAGIELGKQGAKAAAQTRAQQMDSFAKVAFMKHPDMAPPKPVGRNVRAESFMEALQIGTSLVGAVSGLGGIQAPMKAAGGGGGSLLFGGLSDRRAKENIKKLGESPSGLGIYKFNYIGNAKKYIGAMADDVMKVVPEAVSTMANGFLGVNYNLIDVQFKEVV